MQTIKFMWNGIKVDGKLYKGHYSIGPYTKESKLPNATITIYSSNYIGFPKIEGIVKINNSDIMTDYFEKDKLLIMPGKQYYAMAMEAYSKQNEHYAKKYSA